MCVIRQRLTVALCICFSPFFHLQTTASHKQKRNSYKRRENSHLRISKSKSKYHKIRISPKKYITKSEYHQIKISPTQDITIIFQWAVNLSAAFVALCSIPIPPHCYTYIPIFTYTLRFTTPPHCYVLFNTKIY